MNIHTESPHVSTILRPMGIGDLLDRAIYFYRTHFLSLLTYTGLFVVPISLLSALVSLPTSGMALFNPEIIETNPEVFGASYILTFFAAMLLGLVSVVIFPLQVGGVGIALYGFLFEERRVSLREMVAGVREQFSPLLGTGILGMLLSAVMIFLFIIPPVGMAVGTLYSFALYLAVFVVLYEKRSGLEALRRGWILVRSSIWRVLGYLLLFYIFSMFFGLIIGGLLGGAMAGLMIWAENPIFILLIQTMATLLTGLFFSPLQYGVTGLLYFDLRVRHEGLDVALAAAEAAGEPLDLASAPISEEEILNDRTWRAVGALSALYTGIFVLFCGCIFMLVFILRSMT